MFSCWDTRTITCRTGGRRGKEERKAAACAKEKREQPQNKGEKNSERIRCGNRSISEQVLGLCLGGAHVDEK